jgi:hypothetical protein
MHSPLRLITRLCAVTLLGLGAAPALAADSIDALAQDVGRLESLRQVKDLQRTYVHLSQAGLWNEMGALFSRDAEFVRGAQTIAGSDAIAKWLTQQGGGRQGLPAGAMRFEFIDQPLANLSADGRSAKVRWMGLLMSGDGQGGTRIEGGIYENEYVLDGRTWKISLSRYYPQYEGDHAEGWYNIDNGELPVVPYHFTLAESGIPLPPATGTPPRSGATLADLERRVQALNDEDKVRNLQHAYGYYVDRRMWDDVVDLFAKDAVVEIAGVGTFRGPEGVRRAMERMGPAGLTQGVLNDRPIFDAIVRVQRGVPQPLREGRRHLEVPRAAPVPRGEGGLRGRLGQGRRVSSGQPRHPGVRRRASGDRTRHQRRALPAAGRHATDWHHRGRRCGAARQRCRKTGGGAPGLGALGCVGRHGERLLRVQLLHR